MNTTPNSHLSQLSPTDPDLELYQWQKLADYSDSGFSHFYFRELSFSSEPTSILRKRFEAIVSVLGVMAALFLLGSAMWHHSPQRERWSPLVGERTEVEYLRTI